MEISNYHKQIIITTLQTLHHNKLKDLYSNIDIAKKELPVDLYIRMIDGDEFIYDETKNIEDKHKYRKLNFLDGRWCLKTILFYHFTKIKNFSEEEYNQINNYID